MKRNQCQGNILIVAMILVVVISSFVLTSLNATNNSGRLADRSRDYAAAQAAAEVPWSTPMESGKRASCPGTAP